MKEDLKLLLKHALFFLTLYFIVILVCGGLVTYFNISPIDAENERALIGTIIQSQAAIIAIVITLSLVAIQIAASQYSSTLVDYIKRHPDFWILLTIYVISILYGFVILKTLNTNEPGIIHGISANNFVGLEFGIAVYSIIILIPFIVSTTNLLSANKFIDDLSKKINKNAILLKDENFSLFFNVIESSMLKNDLEVATTGLLKFNAVVIPIIQRSTKEEINQIIEVYNERLTKIQISSQNLHQDYITVIASNCFYNVAETTTNRDLPEKVRLQISALYNIAKYAIENNSYFVFNTTLHLIKEIALKSYEKNQQNNYSLSLDAIKLLGQLSIHQHNQSDLTLCDEKLEVLAKYQIEKENNTGLSEILCIYTTFLEDAVLQNFLSVLSDICTSMYELENKLILKNQSFEMSMIQVANNFKIIGNSSLASSQIVVFAESLEYLREMYFFSIDSHLEKLEMFCLYSLNEIEKNAIKSKDNEDLIYMLIKSQQAIIQKYLVPCEVKHFDAFVDTNAQIVNYLMSTNQQELSRELLTDLNQLQKQLISKGSDEKSQQLLKFFYTIGKSLIEKNIFDFTFVAPLNILKEMDYDILLKEPDENSALIYIIIRSMGEAGCDASNANLEKSMKYSIISLGHLYGKCSEAGYFGGQQTILVSMLMIGSTSFDHGMREAILTVIHQIEFMRGVVKKKLQDSQLIDAELFIGYTAVQSKMEDISLICATHLANLPSEERSIVDKKIAKYLGTLSEASERTVVTEFEDLYHKVLSEKETHSTDD